MYQLGRFDGIRPMDRYVTVHSSHIDMTCLGMYIWFTITINHYL